MMERIKEVSKIKIIEIRIKIRNSHKILMKAHHLEIVIFLVKINHITKEQLNNNQYKLPIRYMECSK